MHDLAMVWLVCAREIRSGRAAGSGEGTHRCTVQCDVPPLDLVKKRARMHACARPKARGSFAALLPREIRSAQLGKASAGESPSASSTTVGADGWGLCWLVPSGPRSKRPFAMDHRFSFSTSACPAPFNGR